MYSGKIAVPPGGGGIVYKKLFEARHNTQNAKVAVGTMVIISTNLEKTIFLVEMCQNVPEEIRKKAQFVTNEVYNCIRKGVCLVSSPEQ
jgi:hypothetical protein